METSLTDEKGLVIEKRGSVFHIVWQGEFLGTAEWTGRGWNRETHHSLRPAERTEYLRACKLLDAHELRERSRFVPAPIDVMPFHEDEF